MRIFQLNDQEYQNLITLYSDYQLDNSNEYVCFFAKRPKCTITVFFNKKGEHKAVFDGESENYEVLSLNLQNEVIKEKKTKIKKSWIDLNDQIGSDEVGTGDSFLPCIVVAAYVKKEDIDYLNQIGMDDSKRLTDEKIMEIGPDLIAHFENRFSKLTLSNEKYNEMYKKGENINSLKARLHNQVLYNLHSKYQNVEKIYVDQFCEPSIYYHYLSKDKNIVDTITFHTKGESFYPSVAVGSVIARYSLLLVKEKLESRYEMEFPFGSNGQADKFGKEFIEKHGENEYKKIAKLNFKNVRDLLEPKLI